jgi:signal transduction histidine kinase
MTFDRPLLAASWRSWYANDLRVVGPGWLQWLWTALFSLGVGLVFFLLGLGFMLMGSGRWPSAAGVGRFLWANMVIALTIGGVIHLLFMLFAPAIGRERIRAFSSPMRGLYFGGVPLAGVLIGWPVGAWMVDVHSWFPLQQSPSVVASLLLSVLLCAGFYLHFDTKARQYEAEKRAVEARLRLLQGQIEPHFMFNTLANVLSLIDCDVPRARQMLETFIDYLRASLTRLREGDATLGEELAMTEAYLALMRMRMGERLNYRIEVADPALRHTGMPPLLLQPLVENAIQHGLECKVDGGTVTVTARRDAASLVIEVADDGLGECEQPARHAGASGNGVALDNLRARLLARYGGAAGLTLELRADAGARATLRLPIEAATA